MLNLFKATARVLRSPHGARFFSVKCIADLKLTQERAKRVVDSLNTTAVPELLELPMVTQHLAKTLDEHKNKFGRITLHTTWTKIGDLDINQMKDLCIALSESNDAVDLKMDPNGEEDEPRNTGPESAKEVNHVKSENDIEPKELQERTSKKLISNIKAEEEDRNKIIEYSLGLNAIVPSLRTMEVPASVVSVSIESSCVAWCSMTRDLEVHSWELRPVLSTQGGKNTFPQIYEEFCSLYDAMPLLSEDGLYLTEESGSRLPVFKARHEAIFFSVVAERQATRARMQGSEAAEFVRSLHHRSQHQHVYRLKPSVVINAFNLDVGGQRVSCNNTILDIKRGRCPPPAEGIRIPDFLYSQWYRLRRYDQYVAGNSLLTALAFYSKLRQSARDEKSPPKKERSRKMAAEL